MTIEVYAHELLRLTVDDLGDEILVGIKDPENQTEEHLAHLRKLVDQRAEKDQSRPIDAGELGDRLGRLSSRVSPPAPGYRSSSASTIDPEKDKEEGWQEEVEAYHALVAEGGRPSHPVTFGYDVIDNPEEYEQYRDILWFWHSQYGGYYAEFRYQLIEWREFREYQDRKRRYYVPRNRLQEYETLIRESQADAGCKWDLPVLEDRHQQNRLEDWNEFRAFYYRRLKAYEKLVAPAKQNLLLREKQLKDAQSRLTDVISDPQVLSARIGDIVASRRAIAEANSRVESAEKELEAAQRNKSKKETALIEIAQQKLHSAGDNLKQVSGSEEMRRLRDGSELQCAEEVVVIAGAELRAAQLDVKRWEVFVKWIDAQYPAIAAECGYINNDSRNNVTQRFGGIGRKQTLRARPHRRKDVETKSVLSPYSSSRISKSSKRKPDRTRQVIRAQILSPSTTQQHPVEKPIPRRRSERLQPSKDRQTRQVPNMNVLHSVRSAKVTKTPKRDVTSGQQSTQRGRPIAKRSPGTKQTATSRNSTLRKSQRLVAQHGHCGFQ
ncbi:uncharacterized protein PV07_10540 [Cladophialophora immunda]|uniref:Uncharacterized protein n=1 Tax=Cladophialophora immunda TaxID=569365 RepID=A0A0D2AIW7_9EURO|nr:uncharacterized protein PV07_10540 [Cladophialophora immunda]KIW24852.1 hypothetical protein PV07_10540 [Cladophialophora immunda]